MTAPVAQVQLADVVIINKTDLVDSQKIDETKERINKINPNSEVLFAKHADIDFKLIGNNNEVDILSGLTPCAPEDYQRFEFSAENAIDKIKFYAILDEYRNIILRAKGVALFDDKRFFVEVVNGQVSSKPLSETNLKLNNAQTAISFILRENTLCDFRKKMNNIKN